jgi:ABC-type hemin transport system substrate-binding protein
MAKSRFGFSISKLHCYRRLVRMAPILVVFACILTVVTGLHLAERYTGRLELSRMPGEYGTYRATDSTAYPRKAIDAQGYRLKIDRLLDRVASQYWSIDEFAYAVLPAQDVVAVSMYAYDKKSSNVLPLAENYRPAIATDPEVILKVDPNLLLVAGTTRADFTDLLRNAGTPLFRMFTNFTTLDEIDRGILLAGYLTGRDDFALRVHEEFQKSITRARARRPPGIPAPRILGYSGGYSYGDQTLFDDIARTLGAVNVGAENGLHGYEPANSENILRWNPEWIVSGAANGSTADALERLMQDPAIDHTTAGQKKQILVFDNKVFLPMSPFTTQLVDALSEVLYANPR